MIKNRSIQSTIHHLVILPLCVLLISCNTTNMNQFSSALQNKQLPLNNQTITAGLKQALEIGINNSLDKTNKNGGFGSNPLINIAIPPEFKNVVSALRTLGMDSYIDSLETQMNQAAQTASKEAKKVFISTISKMSIGDAKAILDGKNNAATEYFRKSSSNQLREKFKPIIQDSMSKLGFYSNYKSLLRAYDAIPFTTKPDLNIENYLVQKSLDGVFLLLADEEKKIRKDPASRVTDLLKIVFSEQGK